MGASLDLAAFAAVGATAMTPCLRGLVGAREGAPALPLRLGTELPPFSPKAATSLPQHQWALGFVAMPFNGMMNPPVL